MLATGIKSAIEIKVSGANLDDIDRTARQIEAVVRTVPGITFALDAPLSGGRYIDVDQPDRGGAIRPLRRRCISCGFRRDRRRG